MPRIYQLTKAKTRSIRNTSVLIHCWILLRCHKQAGLNQL